MSSAESTSASASTSTSTLVLKRRNVTAPVALPTTQSTSLNTVPVQQIPVVNQQSSQMDGFASPFRQSLITNQINSMQSLVNPMIYSQRNNSFNPASLIAGAPKILSQVPPHRAASSSQINSISPLHSLKPRVVTGYTPTFLLRGINCYEIVMKYLNSYFADIAIPESHRLDKSQIMLSFAHQDGNNPDDETYTYVDRSNQSQRVLTTNHHDYAIVRSLSLNAPIPETSDSYICHWCRRQRNDLKIGIPFNFVYDFGLNIFNVDGHYCSFDCCYADLRLNNNQNGVINRNSIYLNSETLLRLLFDLIYPGQKLTPAADWKLLKSNGGPLDDDEFDNKKLVLLKTSNIILFPIKVEILAKFQKK